MSESETHTPAMYWAHNFKNPCHCDDCFIYRDRETKESVQKMMEEITSRGLVCMTACAGIAKPEEVIPKMIEALRGIHLKKDDEGYYQIMNGDESAFLIEDALASLPEDGGKNDQ